MYYIINLLFTFKTIDIKKNSFTSCNLKAQLNQQEKNSF